MKFELSERQYKLFTELDAKHECELKIYSGANGGRLAFCFTPTSLGLITTIKCGCGHEYPLTDFESW